MRRPLLLLVACCCPAPVVGQAVTLDPELALAAERIFRVMDTEVVFCLHADATPLGSWHVRAVQLAPHGTAADRDAASFDCRGADGFMHNHPRRGSEWCRLSDADRITLQNYRFAVLWCPTGRFSYEVRQAPGDIAAGRGPIRPRPRPKSKLPPESGEALGVQTAGRLHRTTSRNARHRHPPVSGVPPEPARAPRRKLYTKGRQWSTMAFVLLLREEILREAGWRNGHGSVPAPRAGKSPRAIRSPS